ncbi:diacylglycerol/lipid kinase family protein [Brachybacterium saurashtrense]|uniref:Sphingosine kinase n=1 Tax=Brachybacterium saurashtrense TaxID=556288 RepID=A0A345YK46_9MICO|nr:diacylglycerol kinase family protein [Brachybacterium saurashtrense]AXK44298.1 sphingosine kinase [Brachybacterium saurashtrense]RRR21334.1 sphingosine kinase [Brachybacterium saurashtrense]RRR22909.1 sphingosine kinase [Brachybacterium saurashtrense]
MDLTLLLLSIASVVIAAVTAALLVVVLRHLGRHRRELAALKATTERLDGRPGPAASGDAAGGGASTADAAGPDGDVAEAGTSDAIGRVAVVLNPSKFARTDAFRRTVTEAVERLEDAETVFYETSIDDPGRGQTEQAVAEGADLVLAAGGDGTVRMVASVLAGTDTRMGIIPAGTGNLLARNVDVPLEDPSAAVVAALTGEDRWVDVGWLRVGDSVRAVRAAERQIFLVIAGFGADAEMIGYTDPRMKKRIGWIAYVFGGIRTVLGRSVDVVVQLPDESRYALKARTVLLGNVGRLPGGLVLMPDATIDNGQLEVVVAGWRGAAGFSQVAAQVVNPRLRPRIGAKLSTMERYLTTGIRVTTTKPQPVQLDGDTDVEATHLVATVDPGVLRLRVPSGTRAGTR